MEKYIIVTLKDWNINQFYKSKFNYKKNWFLITNPKKLTFKYINSIKPKYIFFPHWSYKVNSKITQNFDCICFHETDLPYGRGGSPIQNLILRHHKTTVICALKMIDILDAGPIYLKRKLRLDGNAQKIFERASKIIFKMIETIVKKEILPKRQRGKVVKFKRLKKQNSEISKKILSLKDLYNHIRMLDAKSYPVGYINYGNLRIEFKKAKLCKKSISSSVNIKLL